jgi:putative addiction module antidote
MIERKIERVGNSLGMRVPREVLSGLNLADGDRVILTESAEGGCRLTPYDPSFVCQMKASEERMRRYGNTLTALGR